MSALSNLQPKLLWDWFARICAIPHPTFHEEAIVEYVSNWAKEKGFFVGQDQAGNVLIRKPATPGKENVPSVCIQAHFDMVPQANADKQHDFTKDPIVPRVEGDYVYATDTTLGADNGIGLAAVLALFDDDSFEHGPLEGLLTRSEEVGMLGAVGLQENWLQSEYFINTDSEEWGDVYLGCAGGKDLNLTQTYDWKPVKEGSTLVTLRLTGFRGGHSGADIHTNRESAIRYLNKLLFAVYQEVKFNFVDYYAGQARNAICREATAVFAVTKDNLEAFKASLAKFLPIVQDVFKDAEKEGKFEVEYSSDIAGKTRLSCSDMPNLLRFLVNLPNGLLRYSDVFPGITETSLSVGLVRINPQDQFYYKILARSLKDDALHLLTNEIKGYCELAGFNYNESGFYTGWVPEHTAFSNFVIQRYEQLIGKKVGVNVIHAGLECGIIKGHYPNLKILSLGPNLHNPHTPKEHVEISSTEGFYKLLVDLLANLPADAALKAEYAPK